MLNDTFANRLKIALEMNNMKPIDLARKTKINKSLISSYMSGVCKAKQDKLDLMATVLNVNEAWLMGYDVPMDRIITEKTKSDILRDKIENLSDLQKDAIIQIIDNMK
jgi:transcriptional regulator with XRE-family HTH domain